MTYRQTPAPAKGPQEYAYGLDLVRFGAASLVAFFHFTFKSPNASIAALGWVGVQTFFVISGLVIVNSAEGTRPRQFVMHRFLRLYPAALICALIGAAALYATPEGLPTNFPRQLIDSILLLPRAPWIASAYWTLPIEIAFYLVILILLLTGQIRNIVSLSWALIACCALFVAFLWCQQLGAQVLPRLDYKYGLVNISLLRHGEFFAIGVLMLHGIKHGLSPRVIWLFSGAMIVGLAEIFLRGSEYAAINGLGLSTLRLGGSAALLWVSTLIAIWLSAANPQIFAGKQRIRKIIRQLGLMSYPLYLLHERIGWLTIHWVGIHAGVPRSAAIGAAYMAAVAFSFLVAYLLEPRLRRIFAFGLSVFGGRLLLRNQTH